MAKMLTLDEMLGVMIEEQWPGHRAFKQMVENLATAMADIIADKIGCTHRPALFEDGLTMAAFSPLMAGDGVPRELTDLDPSGEWEPRT